MMPNTNTSMDEEPQAIDRLMFFEIISSSMSVSVSREQKLTNSSHVVADEMFPYMELEENFEENNNAGVEKLITERGVHLNFDNNFGDLFDDNDLD